MQSKFVHKLRQQWEMRINNLYESRYVRIAVSASDRATIVIGVHMQLNNKVINDLSVLARRNNGSNSWKIFTGDFNGLEKFVIS